jgi:outer membrane biosynthesis protein TonB
MLALYLESARLTENLPALCAAHIVHLIDSKPQSVGSIPAFSRGTGGCSMKLRYIISAAALSLVLTGTAYSQQEQEKEKPQQQEQKPAEQPKTQQRQEQQSAKQQQQEQKNEQKQEKQSARQQNEQKQSEQSNRERQDQQKQLTRQQQEDQKQQQHQQQQVAKQQRGDEQRNERSGGGHGRIPDDRFRASFGREHHFRVGHFDNRRFQYGGYWFSFNEGWPVGWAYTDEFYIDFIDGQYYLIDLTHPGVQLLLVVD